MIVSFYMLFLSLIVLVFFNTSQAKATADEEKLPASKPKKSIPYNNSNDMALAISNSQPKDDVTPEASQGDEIISSTKLIRTISAAEPSTNMNDGDSKS